MQMEAANVFLLGLGILLGWMAVILFFSRPQLFRDFVKRYCCCQDVEGKRRADAIRQAQAKLHEARKSIVATSVGYPQSLIVEQFLKQGGLDDDTEDEFLRARLQKIQAIHDLERLQPVPILLPAPSHQRTAQKSDMHRKSLHQQRFDPITEASNSSATSREELRDATVKVKRTLSRYDNFPPSRHVADVRIEMEQLASTSQQDQF